MRSTFLTTAIVWAALAQMANAGSAPKVEMDSSSLISFKGDWSTDLSGTISPFGTLAQSGWRGRVSAVASGYTYRDGSPRVAVGRDIGADLLAGYAFVGDGYALSLFAGPAIREAILSATVDTRIGSKLGLKTTVGLYARTKDMMVSGHLRYTSLRNVIQGEAATGWTMWGDYYVGPEIAFLRSDTYWNIRAGGHLSAYRIGNVHAAVKAGVSLNKNKAVGGYIGLGIYSGF